MNRMILTAVAAAACSWTTAARADDKEMKAAPPAEFVTKAAQSGMFEVMSSQLAKTQAGSDKVKMFADHMVADHTKANDELKALAGKKGWAVPEGMSPMQADHLKGLGKLQSNDFDKEYTMVQVKAHKMAVALFKAQAKGGDDADLKAWAEKTLPTLEKHLEHAEKMAGK